MTHETKLTSITEFNSERGQSTLHPLVTVLDQSKSKIIRTQKYKSELYIIFLKDAKCEDFQYGRSAYDYQENTLIFISPDQVFGYEDEDEDRKIVPNGWALAFHPNLLHGLALSHNILDYSFFSYDVTEALHISEAEKVIIKDCFHKIRLELENGVDRHSRNVIVSHIEVLLNYSERFYDRQFISREIINKNVLAKFERLINQYYKSEKPKEIGMLSVGYCANEMNLSANYFGDLIKKETGRSAKDYIHSRVIALAKNRVFDLRKSISEISSEFGFKYPQHFTRFFKNKVGCTPKEYRNQN